MLVNCPEISTKLPASLFRLGREGKAECGE